MRCPVLSAGVGGYTTLCVYMCIYIYINVMIIICHNITFLNLYIIDTYAYIHAYMHACIHVRIHTRMHTYMHACIHARIHTCLHAYVCIAYMMISIFIYESTCTRCSPFLAEGSVDGFGQDWDSKAFTGLEAGGKMGNAL